jgi:hypothetical protein
MKKVLLTTSAIVGLSVPSFAADPTAVSDQPYFHHSHPMTWSGSMSVSLTNLSTQDADDATLKAQKKDYIFGLLTGASLTALNGNGPGDPTASTGVGANEERIVGAFDTLAAQGNVASLLTNMISVANTASTVTITAGATANSTLEDLIDDYLGGSHSEAMDVIMEQAGNALDAGSNAADLAADLKAFADAQDAGTEAIETTASINTTASLGVSMAAGDGWTAATSGSINLGSGSVSAGAMSISNGMLTIGVGKSQHSAAAAVSTVFGMDRALNSNAADTVLSATMNLGGASIAVDNEMDGDNLETTNQTVGIKGAYGTMSYGLGWESDGDLGFSIGTSLGGVGLTITRVNTGSSYSMGLGASMDLGGGMTLSATNAQNSDGLTDKVFSNSAISGTSTTSFAMTDTLGAVLLTRAVHKSISTVGLNYAGGGTSVGVTYQEKAGTSSTGDNLIASGSMAMSPTITLTGTYNKDSAVTTIGASGPLGSAGTLSAVMSSTGSSKLTASFKF